MDDGLTLRHYAEVHNSILYPNMRQKLLEILAEDLSFTLQPV